MNIYVSGSLAYDRIMDFPGRFQDHILPDKLHILNVCFMVNGLKENFGGTAGNIAYSLALLGERPVVLATIGKDGANYLGWLERHGVATERIRTVDDEFTAGAYITTDQSDNQITGFNPGAMRHRTEFGFDGDKAGTALAILAPGNLDDMRQFARDCRTKGIPYICDPGQSLPAWSGDDLKEWIAGSYMLITNDYEFELICRATGLDKQALLGMTRWVVTTLGERGVAISGAEGEEIAVPALKLDTVADPTGAGDAFRSGLIKGIVTGRDMAVCARMGVVSAAYAVEKYGTQEHAYSWDEFSHRYAAAFGTL